MSISSLFSTKLPTQPSMEMVRRSLQKQRFGDKNFLATNQGLGIVLDAERSGYKFIRRIIPNSPADECGNMRVGDRVLEINGTDVSRINVKECGVLVSECDKIVSFVLSRKIDRQQQRKLRKKSVLSTSSSESSSPTASSSSSSGDASSSSPSASSASSRLSAGTSQKKNEKDSGVPRIRSDSEASDTATVTMHDDDDEDGIGEDLVDIDSEVTDSEGRVEISVLLEKGKVIDDNEELLQRVLYSKGHLSFIKGTALGSKNRFETRWIAVRHGKLIVTKGTNATITKTVDLTKCVITKMLQSAPNVCPPEFFVGVKVTGKPTMYFGDSNREAVERLVLTIKGPSQCENSAVDLKTSPAGFCAARMPIASDYAPLIEAPYSLSSSSSSRAVKAR